MVNQVLLGLDDLVIGKRRQVVDDRVLADRSLDLDERELLGRLLLSRLEVFDLLQPLLAAELPVLVLGHRLVALLCALVRTGEGARVLLDDLGRLAGDGLHVNELVLEHVHESVAETRNNIREVPLLRAEGWLSSGRYRNRQARSILELAKHHLRG